MMILQRDAVDSIECLQQHVDDPGRSGTEARIALANIRHAMETH